MQMCHFSVSGSSPLARGTRGRGYPPWSCLRLIPARAGNTHAPMTRQRSHTAHPRSRGEHTVSVEPPSQTGGSSPLARGTRLIVFPGYGVGRLIPARAGNTVYRAAYHIPYSAHPRSRGEHETSNTTVSKRSGSSPLARGTPVNLAKNHRRERLIPARAGNTGFPIITETCNAAHPRSRGEHIG